MNEAQDATMFDNDDAGPMTEQREAEVDSVLSSLLDGDDGDSADQESADQEADNRTDDAGPERETADDAETDAETDNGDDATQPEDDAGEEAEEETHDEPTVTREDRQAAYRIALAHGKSPEDIRNFTPEDVAFWADMPEPGEQAADRKAAEQGPADPMAAARKAAAVQVRGVLGEDADDATVQKMAEMLAQTAIGDPQQMAQRESQARELAVYKAAAEGSPEVLTPAVRAQIDAVIQSGLADGSAAKRFTSYEDFAADAIKGVLAKQSDAQAAADRRADSGRKNRGQPAGSLATQRKAQRPKALTDDQKRDIALDLAVNKGMGPKEIEQHMRDQGYTV